MKTSGATLIPLAIVPVVASITIGLALLSMIGAIPRIPVASELLGLAAVLIAPGLAAEPALRGRGWTAPERFGLAAALSLACCALAGVLLHVAGLPVSTANVLVVLLGVSVVLGLASLPHRSRPLSRSVTQRLPADALVGIFSVALLGVGFATILVASPAPAQPPLEIALVDGAGSLLVQPVPVSIQGGSRIHVAFRSPSGSAPSVGLTVDGDGLQTTTLEIRPTSTWATIDVPLVALRSGTIRATLEVHGEGVDLVIPVELGAT